MNPLNPLTLKQKIIDRVMFQRILDELKTLQPYAESLRKGAGFYLQTAEPFADIPASLIRQYETGKMLRSKPLNLIKLLSFYRMLESTHDEFAGHLGTPTEDASLRLNISSPDEQGS